jgi:hypothetical protein
MDSFGKRSSPGPNGRNADESHGARAGRVVTVLLIVCLALPIVTAVSIFGSVNLHLWRGLPTLDPLLSKMESAQERSGVMSGDDPRLLKRLYQRLEKMAAPSAEARHADFVHVILLSFPPATKQAGPRAQSVLESRKDAAVQRASLDLSAIGTSAAVLIADQPVIWEIAGARPDQRAKIGFEGPFAFDLVGAHSGLLAGFRVSAFGGGLTARPRDYLEAGADRTYQRRACASIDRWQSYFDVRSENLGIWSIDNAQAIKVGPNDVVAGSRAHLSRYSVASICSRR